MIQNNPEIKQALSSLLLSKLPNFEGFDRDGERPMLELGLDSLKAIGILISIEEIIGFPIPDEMITAESFDTPTSLFELVLGVVNHKASF